MSSKLLSRALSILASLLAVVLAAELSQKITKLESLLNEIMSSPELIQKNPELISMLKAKVSILERSSGINSRPYSKLTPLGQSSNCTTQILSLWSWSGSVCANCTSCSYPAGSQNLSLMCRPCNNYTYTTGNQSIWTGERSSYNGDGWERVYYSDCPYSYSMNSMNTTCRWAVECDRNYYNSFGFNCSVFSNRSSYNPPQQNCRSQLIYGYSSGYYYTSMANCTQCNQTATNGSLNQWVNCQPLSNYTYRTWDTYPHAFNVSNYTSTDGIERFFDTDCQGGNFTNTSNCYWCVSCIKSMYTNSFSCSQCPNNTTPVGPNCTNVTFSGYDYNRYTPLYSSCQICTNSTGGSSINCNPYYYTWQYPYANQVVSTTVYNYSSVDYQTKYFMTDCQNGDYYSMRCNWITGCSRNYNGYNCWVYANASTTPSNPCKSQTFSNYSYTSGNYLEGNCSSCNTSMATNDLNCQPYNYAFKTNVTWVSSFNMSNYSSPDYVTRYYTSDCVDQSYMSLNCGWVMACTRDWSWFGYNCIIYSNATKNTMVTKAFKVAVDMGFEWCANCTMNTTNLDLRCNQCTSWTNYTNSSCSNRIVTGESWKGEVPCSNCTVCNDGYFSCLPCRASTVLSAPQSPLLPPKKRLPIEVKAHDV